MRCEGIDLNVNVLLAPGGKSRQPILFFDRLLDAWPLFGREYARCGRERRTGDFASDGASSDSHLGIIPNTFVFSGVAACLHIQLVVCFSKPHGGRNRYTSFAEGGEADVLLALNFARDGHRDIVREGTDLGGAENRPPCGSGNSGFWAGKIQPARSAQGDCPDGVGTPVTPYVAREALGMLQARDAQMDERALEAPQKGASQGWN